MVGNEIQGKGGREDKDEQMMLQRQLNLGRQEFDWKTLMMQKTSSEKMSMTEVG